MQTNLQDSKPKSSNCTGSMERIEELLIVSQRAEWLINEWFRNQKLKINKSIYWEKIIIISFPALVVSLTMCCGKEDIRFRLVILMMFLVPTIFLYLSLKTYIKNVSLRLSGINPKEYKEYKDRRIYVPQITKSIKNILSLRDYTDSCDEQSVTQEQKKVVYKCLKQLNDEIPNNIFSVSDDTLNIIKLHFELLRFKKRIEDVLNRISDSKINGQTKEQSHTSTRSIPNEQKAQNLISSTTAKIELLSKANQLDQPKVISDSAKRFEVLEPKTKSNDYPNSLDINVELPKDHFKEKTESKKEKRSKEINPKKSRNKHNQIEIQKHNKEIGTQGELFVINFEKQTLMKAGRNDLASLVAHVAIEIGDGLGYDIASFDINGNSKFIEVKTTEKGITTPFFLTENELSTLMQKENTFIYRVYNFQEVTKQAELLIIDPKKDLDRFYKLLPTTYQAIPNT